VKIGKLYIFLSILAVGTLLGKEYSVKEVQNIGEKVAKEVKKTLKKRVRDAKKKGGLEAVAKYCMEESHKDIEKFKKNMMKVSK